MSTVSIAINSADRRKFNGVYDECADRAHVKILGEILHVDSLVYREEPGGRLVYVGIPAQFATEFLSDELHKSGITFTVERGA